MWLCVRLKRLQGVREPVCCVCYGKPHNCGWRQMDDHMKLAYRAALHVAVATMDVRSHGVWPAVPTLAPGFVTIPA